MKVALAVEKVQSSEREVARELVRIGERHAVEHDIFHTAHTLAHQSEAHLQQLAPFARKYGTPEADADAGSSGILERLRQKGSEILGRSQAAGPMLLEDLRELYLVVQRAELEWVILNQVAQAVRDGELHEMATSCHEAAEIRGKWLRTRIKESAPQVYAI